jgi:hypothetical protein
MAADNGHLMVLQLARANGCPWDKAKRVNRPRHLGTGIYYIGPEPMVALATQRIWIL